MSSSGLRPARTLALYTLMTAAAVAVFFLIRIVGGSMTPAPAYSATPTVSAPASEPDVLLHVLLAIATIIVVTRATGALFALIRQPAVIGEVVGGILLGPSLLGRIAPDAAAYILPAEVAPILGVISQLGVILYMFMVGLELDLNMIRHSGRATLAISHASISLPFLLGSTLALLLFPSMAGDGYSFTVFALFIGVSMSVTAFPVLARILTDNAVQNTSLGVMALSCAAVDDVTAWCLLALVVSSAQRDAAGALWSFALTIAFIFSMVRIASPLLRRWVFWIDTRPALKKGSVAVILVAMLLSALATELIGIHAIFGSFLLGAIVPHDSRLAAELRRRLEDVVMVFLLPAFFAFVGLRTEFGLITGWQNWLLCLLIIVVASLGKFGGTLLAGRFSGLSWRASSALGVLMNTRGLVELVVLNIGMDLGLISPTLFAMLVIMALVTTFATAPILHVIMGVHAWDQELTVSGPNGESPAKAI